MTLSDVGFQVTLYSSTSDNSTLVGLQDGVIISIHWQIDKKLHCGPSNSAIFNNLERPLNRISRARYYLMSNISETVQERDRVTMEY